MQNIDCYKCQNIFSTRIMWIQNVINDWFDKWLIQVDT